MGEVIFAPVHVFLDEYNSPQPDLVYVDKTKADLITNDGIVGVPTLVVEVISPSPVYRDRVTKKALYERFGVQAYWLVDPADEYVENFTLVEGQCQLLSAASLEEGQLTSNVLTSLPLELKNLFA